MRFLVFHSVFLLSFCAIAPSAVADPMKKLPKEEWPVFEPPTLQHAAFIEPTGVWKAHGGHFLAFEEGEFGAGFFFLKEGERKLELLFKDHVNTMGYQHGPAYVTAGGLTHRVDHGAVFRLWLDKNLNWKSRQLFHTRTGIPEVITASGDQVSIAIFKRKQQLFEQSSERTATGLLIVDRDGKLEIESVPE